MCVCVHGVNGRVEASGSAVAVAPWRHPQPKTLTRTPTGRPRMCRRSLPAQPWLH